MSTTDTLPQPSAKDLVAKSFADVSAWYGGKIEDPHAIYRERRETTPVMKGDIVADLGVVSFAGASEKRDIYTLFKHADVLKVLRDTKNFTSGILMENGLGSFLDGLMITGLDGEPHRSLRGLLAPSFTPAVMDDWRRTMVRPLLEEEFIKPLAAKGKSELMKDIGIEFPIRVVYTVLGYPNDPERVEHFAACALKILGGPSPDPAAKAAAFEGFKELYEPTRAAVEARRAEGATGDDLMSRLIRAEFEGRSLSDHEIANFVRMMLPAASETTSRTFGTLVYILLTRPDLMERVRADRTLLRKALDESMRWEPVATFKVRETQNDVNFQGVDIPKGSILSLAVASANRDPDAFGDNADEFDLDRAQKPSFGFGFGPHMCLGMWLAKAEIEECVDLMLDYMPNLRIDPDLPPPHIQGVQMRGPNALNVVWDKA